MFYFYIFFIQIGSGIGISLENLSIIPFFKLNIEIESDFKLQENSLLSSKIKSLGEFIFL